MALSGAFRARFLVGGFLGLSLLQTGCLPNPVSVSANPTPLATPVPQEAQIRSQDFNQLGVEGTILGPSSLGDGTRVTADSPDLATPIDLYRVAQAFDKELPLKNAVITLKGYDWTVVPNLPAKVSDEKGKFTFVYVPARVAFFMDATYSHGGQHYQMFGLVRTLEASEVTVTTVDIASTLVSRLLLRLMQYAAHPEGINHPIDFKKISPKDYNPLLHTLRDKLRGGAPGGLSIDLTSVRVPTGTWSLEADKADSAVVFLDRLAAQDPVISFQIDQLCEAVAVANGLNRRPGDTGSPLLRPARAF